MKAGTGSSYLGKYREIILAVAFFLVFDLAVLVLNFYISFQISEDALAVNLAGRQRMLSQRMTKALLTIENDAQRGQPNTEALAELQKTVGLFDTTLHGFRHGDTVIGGDEKPVYLAAVSTPEGRAILDKADAIWRPYKDLLAPLTNGGGFQGEQLLRMAEQTLLDINAHLRAAGNGLNYRRTVNVIFRKIHTLKGEAATLGLEMFENLAQQFESLLAGLREKGDVSGNELLALPFPLEEFLQRISMVRNLTARLAAYHDAFSPVPNDDASADNLAKLAQRVAQGHGKEVQLVTDLDLLKSLPQKTRTELQDIAVQLLRNAVAHGIEPAEEREGRAKPAAGNIQVTLKPVESGEYELDAARRRPRPQSAGDSRRAAAFRTLFRNPVEPA